MWNGLLVVFKGFLTILMFDLEPPREGRLSPLSQRRILHISPSPYFPSFSFYSFPLTLTVMLLRIMLNTYWTPLLLGAVCDIVEEALVVV